MPTRNKIFVSYSHKDARLFEEFKTMLAPAIQRGIVDMWDDQKIPPGANWKAEIQKALASASIAVLLVSQNFLASHFIADKELPPLLKAAREEGVIIFWICLSSCLFEQTEIASYQAAHDISRPLDGLQKAQRQAVLSQTCAKLIQAAGRSAPPQQPTGSVSQTPASSEYRPVGEAKPVPLRPPIQQPGQKELRILKELAIGRRMDRTRTSVAKETGIEKPEVDRVMSELARKGLVGNRMVVTKTGENRRLWFITEEGRGAIATPIPVPKSSP
jgi:hypothetical protein